MRDNTAVEGYNYYQQNTNAGGFTYMTTYNLSRDPGPNDATDLTDGQILWQCKTYIAALRIADDFGCDCIGIQYQQGLKDVLPARDLVEGTLNNGDRPPVKSRDGKRVLYDGKPLTTSTKWTSAPGWMDCSPNASTTR